MLECVWRTVLPTEKWVKLRSEPWKYLGEEPCKGRHHSKQSPGMNAQGTERKLVWPDVVTNLSADEIGKLVICSDLRRSRRVW